MQYYYIYATYKFALYNDTNKMSILLTSGYVIFIDVNPL